MASQPALKQDVEVLDDAVQIARRPEAPKNHFRIVPFLLAMFFVSLFYVWTRTEVVKATYELSTLQRQVEVQSQRNRKLRLEALALKAPDRLTAIAIEKLGMKPPGEGQVRVVR